MESDLEGARHTIGILEMLKEKTRGNLDEDEAKLVEGCISTLQLNYFEEVEADKSDGGESQGS